MRTLLLLLAVSICINSFAADKDSTVQYNFPDTLKAISFIADVNVNSIGKKEAFAGIKTEVVSIALESEKKKGEVSFEFPKTATIIATGLDVERERGELEWKLNWQLNTTYKLLLVMQSDSAANLSIYSGYIFLPRENKWKLIGTCKINGQWNTIKQAASFHSINNISAEVNNVWLQRSAGGWKRLDAENSTPLPVINPLPSIDSVAQYNLDKQTILTAMASGKTDVTNDTLGVYYKIMNPGNGKPVSVNDTVTAYYRLRIFGNENILQETKDKSATFPLNRLIKGWQLVVPLVKTGGKVKIVIPSGLAYSIRTRAADIPPNSILEFEVEVVDTKPPGN